jgi:hypothetical protein
MCSFAAGECATDAVGDGESGLMISARSQTTSGDGKRRSKGALWWP